MSFPLTAAVAHQPRCPVCLRLIPEPEWTVVEDRTRPRVIACRDAGCGWAGQATFYSLQTYGAKSLPAIPHDTRN